MLKNQHTINEALQWVGAVFIILGHSLNALGNLDPWNIVAFFLGTIAFLTWTIRVGNRPQGLVNVIAMATCLLGLLRAWL
jgi:hypothetical protein